MCLVLFSLKYKSFLKKFDCKYYTISLSSIYYSKVFLILLIKPKEF